MSALEEYRKYRAAAEITTLSAGIAGLADAAIAELEAENERLEAHRASDKAIMDDINRRRRALEAELAALETRHVILQSRFDQEKAAHESLLDEVHARWAKRGPG